MDEETDDAEPTVVGVLLTRTSWLLILSLVVSELCEEARGLDEQEDWEGGYLDYEDIAEPARKIVPVLLEAVGPGVRDDEITPQKVRRVAETLWTLLGVEPDEKQWAIAREVTIPWPDNQYTRMAEHFLKKAQREEWGEEP